MPTFRAVLGSTVLLGLSGPAVASADLIAFTRTTSLGQGIATIDPDSGRVRVLTSRAGRSDTDPDWSPSGRRIAFTRSTDGRRSLRIAVMAADGSGARLITGGRFDEQAAWRPDGRLIAYQSTGGIRLVRPDGSGNRALPGSRAGDYRPAWAPDGRHILFSRGTGDANAVHVQRPDGGGRRRLAAGWTSDVAPDGRIVALTGRTGGVFTVPFAGGTPRRLARGFEPSWSPSGRRLAYTRWPDDNRMELWVMRADGRGARRLRRDAEAPDWRP